MTVILWHIEVSHYNEKARWALDYKGIPHERRAPMPGLMTGLVAAWRTRGKQRRMPVVQIDGRVIGDSTAIIAALEELKPDPALYPADPEERRRALELEDFFDEELAPNVRRFVFQHTLDDGDAVIDALMPNASERRIRLMRRMAPVVERAVRADYKVDAARAEAALVKIRVAMDRVEAELDGGEYLVGERFSVADLTAAALFTPLLCPPGRQYAPRRMVPAVLEAREELESRRGGQWVTEMFARHRGSSHALQANA